MPPFQPASDLPRENGSTPPPRKGLVLPLALGMVAIALLLALGTWQVKRRSWKLDLIARVERHIHAAPVPAPGPDAWPRIGADDAYTHVRLRGRFLHDRETLVQALTEQGAGFWVVTPMVTDGGFTVLINRGFVPADRAGAATRRAGQIAGEAAVSGLLRLSEPGGSLLRDNQPAAGRWYSRDVAAIARARAAGQVAPYFVDADGTANPGGLPVGGLTVIRFPNNHLVYAITWYGLALLTAWGLIRVVRMRR